MKTYEVILKTEKQDILSTRIFKSGNIQIEIKNWLKAQYHCRPTEKIILSIINSDTSEIKTMEVPQKKYWPSKNHFPIPDGQHIGNNVYCHGVNEDGFACYSGVTLG